MAGNDIQRVQVVNSPGWAVEKTLNDIRTLLAGQVGGLPQQAQQRLSQTAQAAQDDMANQTSAVSALLGQLGSGFGKVAKVGQNLGETLLKADGTFTNMLEGLGGYAALSGVAGMTVKWLDRLNHNYRISLELGQNFNGSITKMAATAYDAGMGLEEMTGLMSKNAQVTTAFGPEQMAQMTTSARKLMRQFGMFGLTAEQANQNFADYLDTQRLMGRSETLNADEAAEAFSKLTEETTLLARMTGRQRADVTKGLMDTMKDYNVALLAQTIGMEKGEEAQKQFEGIVKAAGEMPDGIRESTLAMIKQAGAGFSIASTDQYSALSYVFGDKFQGLMDGFTKGIIPVEQWRQQYLDMFKNATLEEKKKMVLMSNGTSESAQFMQQTIKTWGEVQGSITDADKIAKAKAEIKNPNDFTAFMGSFEDVTKQSTAAMSKVPAAVTGLLEDGFNKLSPAVKDLAKDADALANGQLAVLIQQISGVKTDDIKNSVTQMGDFLGGVPDMLKPHVEDLMKLIGATDGNGNALSLGDAVKKLTENVSGTDAALVAAIAALTAAGGYGLYKMGSGSGSGGFDPSDLSTLFGGAAGIGGLDPLLGGLFGGQPGGAAGAAGGLGGAAQQMGQSSTDLGVAAQNLNAAAQTLSNSGSGFSTALLALSVGLGAIDGIPKIVDLLSGKGQSPDLTQPLTNLTAELGLLRSAMQSNGPGLDQPLASLTGEIGSLRAAIQNFQNNSGSGVDVSGAVTGLNASVTQMTQSLASLASLQSVGDDFNQASRRMEESLMSLQVAFAEVSTNTGRTADGVTEMNNRMRDLKSAVDMVKKAIEDLQDTI